MEKSAWFYCISVHNVRLKKFSCEFKSTVLEKINVFPLNTNLGQVSMIANDMFFQKN